MKPTMFIAPLLFTFTSGFIHMKHTHTHGFSSPKLHKYKHKHSNPSFITMTKSKETNEINIDTNSQKKTPVISYIENPYYMDGDKPNSAFLLALNNFGKQGTALFEQFMADKLNITSSSYIPPNERPPDCLGLTLDNEKVKQAEIKRENSSKDGKIESSVISRTLYDIGCFFLDELFDGRPIARFWFLETIARIPYFSYVSMLHLYESFGWWRGSQLRKIHNAEEDNELHHLLIMEALGGNALWTDRFLGYHAAIFYYWALIALYLFSPRAAYNFMASEEKTDF